MKSSEVMFEGLSRCLNYCLEMELDEERQIIEAFIMRWDEADHNGRRMIYESVILIMREHSVPRRPHSQLDIDLQDLKDMCYSAAKAEWDILGDFLLNHPKSGLHIMNLANYQDYKYRLITTKIRRAVKEGLYKFERNPETGKLELIDLRKEEEE